MATRSPHPPNRRRSMFAAAQIEALIAARTSRAVRDETGEVIKKALPTVQAEEINWARLNGVVIPSTGVGGAEDEQWEDYSDSGAEDAQDAEAREEEAENRADVKMLGLHGIPGAGAYPGGDAKNSIWELVVGTAEGQKALRDVVGQAREEEALRREELQAERRRAEKRRKRRARAARSGTATPARGAASPNRILSTSSSFKDDNGADVIQRFLAATVADNALHVKPKPAPKTAAQLLASHGLTSNAVLAKASQGTATVPHLFDEYEQSRCAARGPHNPHLLSPHAAASSPHASPSSSPHSVSPAASPRHFDHGMLTPRAHDSSAPAAAHGAHSLPTLPSPRDGSARSNTASGADEAELKGGEGGTACSNCGTAGGARCQCSTAASSSPTGAHAPAAAARRGSVGALPRSAALPVACSGPSKEVYLARNTLFATGLVMPERRLSVSAQRFFSRRAPLPRSLSISAPASPRGASPSHHTHPDAWHSERVLLPSAPEPWRSVPASPRPPAPALESTSRLAPMPHPTHHRKLSAPQLTLHAQRSETPQRPRSLSNAGPVSRPFTPESAVPVLSVAPPGVAQATGAAAAGGGGEEAAGSSWAVHLMRPMDAPQRSRAPSPHGFVTLAGHSAPHTDQTPSSSLRLAHTAASDALQPLGLPPRPSKHASAPSSNASSPHAPPHAVSHSPSPSQTTFVIAAPSYEPLFKPPHSSTPTPTAGSPLVLRATPAGPSARMALWSSPAHTTITSAALPSASPVPVP